MTWAAFILGPFFVLLPGLLGRDGVEVGMRPFQRIQRRLRQARRSGLIPCPLPFGCGVVPACFGDYIPEGFIN